MHTQKHWKFILCLIGLFAAVPLTAQENVAIATKVTGEVQLKRADADEFATEVQLGTRIQTNDRVRTGADGYLVLVFLDDKSQLKIQSNSELLMLAKADQQNGQISKEIQMDRGKLKAEVARQQRGKFIIATPTSVASVKGTGFWLKILQSFDQLLVDEGLVTFLNKISGDSVSVKANYGANSSADGTLETFILIGMRGTIRSYDASQGQYTLADYEVTSQPEDTTISVSNTVWTTDQTVLEGDTPSEGAEINVTGTVREDGSVDAVVLSTIETDSGKEEHELKIEFEDAQGNKKTLEIQYKEE